MFLQINTCSVLFKELFEVYRCYRISSYKWTNRVPQLLNTFTAKHVTLYFILDALVIAKKFFHHWEIRITFQNFFYKSTNILFYLRKCLKYHLLSLYNFRSSSCRWTKRGATAYKFFYSQLFDAFVIAKNFFLHWKIHITTQISLTNQHAFCFI